MSSQTSTFTVTVERQNNGRPWTADTSTFTTEYMARAYAQGRVNRMRKTATTGTRLFVITVKFGDHIIQTRTTHS